MLTRLAGVFLLTSLAACSGSGGGRYNEDEYYDKAAEAAAVAEDADQSAEEARQAVYEERGAGSDGSNSDVTNVEAGDVEDNGNYTCTQDCSGHEAGFAWAQENDVADASDCGGNSQSFVEGCEAFAEERQEQADRETQEAADEAAETARYQTDGEPEDEPEDDRGRYIGE